MHQVPSTQTINRGGIAAGSASVRVLSSLIYGLGKEQETGSFLNRISSIIKDRAEPLSHAWLPKADLRYEIGRVYLGSPPRHAWGKSSNARRTTREKNCRMARSGEGYATS